MVGAVAMAAAIAAMQRIGMDQIAAHEAELTAYALRRMGQIDGLRIYGATDPRRSGDRLGVIPFNIGALPYALGAAVLGTEFGIGVRNGCFCAHPYLIKLLGLSQNDVQQVRTSMANGDMNTMPGMVRVSFGMYNTIEDVDALIIALRQIATSAYDGKYILDRARGEYSALGWSPSVVDHFSVANRAK